ncbi:RNA polymerase sigma factor, cyanobacterial RpoD-like family [Synechococcus sp. PCC 7502]|uniref:RNA polymerase sigma factor, RpoD/SigA family n=1 Tax=Synechococcus sp. PCC 7502 TaxID=1173263 RepID=UPI00029FAC13|nr:RNA polymerase sigma factor, RpoD/SigA family [Synechococcus sp. PCC 7502]AFY72214.1 RNA polymerase sigma factor, cyanobacterial RpoD-like family [Synechococcus sp. PCC 7502]
MPKQKLTQSIKSPAKAKQGTLSADMVRTYLHEIGKIPLLTNEEEIIYGKQVQHLMGYITTQETLSEQFDRLPTQEEWAQAVGLEPNALNDALKQGTRAKRKMIEANLRLVVSVAKKYQKRNLELLDLVQEGTLGLERAVDKFDPTKGFKFSTYAYWWIRQAITRAIAQQARTIRLPVHITEKLNKIKKAQRQLAQDLGRVATAAEVAETLEIKPEQVRECLSLARQPISLDLRIGDNQDTELADLLEDQGHSPETYALNESLRDGVQSLLSELSPKQRQVMILRYGLEDGQELSLASISKRMDLSREQVRQLERQAMDALRKRRQRVQEYIIAS